MFLNIFFILFALKDIQALNNLYLFGTDQNDNLMSKKDDSFEGPFKIFPNFTFYGNKFSKLFIGTNGVLSLGNGIRSYMPVSFPAHKYYIIAPFWTDIDLTKAGQIYHREVSDQLTLDQISRDVSLRFGFFDATWAYLITWHEVVPFLSDSYSHKNTFQALIASNGFNSFVIFNYQKLEWSVSKNSPVHAQAGINAGDGFRFDSMPGIFTSDVIKLVNQSNIGIMGKWVFKVDEGELIENDCDFRNVASFNPYSVYVFGGEDVTVSGPCFDLNSKSATVLIDEEEVNCDIINWFTCRFKTPYMKKIGLVRAKLILKNNTINRYLYTKETSYVKIKGVKSIYNASANEEIRLESIPNHSLYDLYLITVTQNSSEKKLIKSGITNTISFNSSHIFNQTSLLDIQRAYFALAPSQNARFFNPLTIFSFVMNFLIFFSSLLARSECIMWYNAQPNPENFINNLPPCPPIIPSNSSSNFFTMYYTDRLCNTFNREKCNIYHPNAQTCYRSFRRWTSYGWAYQKCCYDDQNQLLVGPPGGGTPILWPFNGDGSEYEAYLPYYKCCILSKNCHLYYQKRPSDDSSRWINDGIAFVTGDPHFLTFDGLGYTFNGYGEYNLFQIEDIELMVQVRIAPITINGTQSQGTVYKALSIKANNNTDHIQIELDFKNNLLITLNGEYIDIENESISLKGLHLIVSDGTKIELVYNFGINIEILVSPSRNALTLFSTISQIYMNRTVGLLGNFNADPSDDFILPNGTILNIDAKNDRDIFENYGQKWMIRENDSIFFYELGFGYDSHHDIDYVPKFIQDGLVFNNSDLEIVAKEKCGNNTDCLFDASITGDIEIAKLNLDSDVVAKSFEEVKIHRNNSNNLNSTREFYQITSTETESKAVISSNTKITENYQFINSESTYAYETKSIENSKNPKINQTIFQINTSSFHKALTSLSKVNEISDYIDNHKYSTIFSTKNYFTTNKDTSKNFKTDAIKISDSISPTLSNINQSIFKEKDNNEFGKGRAAMMGKIGSLINLSLFRYF